MDIRTLTLTLTFCFLPTTFALAETDSKSLADMQRQLNQEVITKEFSVEDEAKIDAFIKDAMAKDLKPVEEPPSYWKPGYTCANIIGYSWNAYQNCRYYHSYYGYYW